MSTPEKPQAAIGVGIDVGSLTAEVVLLEQNRLIGFEIMPVLPNPVDSARTLLERLLARHGLMRQNIGYAVSTGYGRETLQETGWADENVSEISCHGFGAFTLDGTVRTIIDIGGQDAKAIRVDPAGQLEKFTMNDKCAAGTGHFLEVMSQTLGVKLEDLAELGRGGKNPTLISSRCTIFAETEVLHFLQRGESRANVAAGIHRAMAERVVALVRRIEPQNEIMITGGVAKNAGVRGELERELKVKIRRPSVDPQIVGAYGAAALACRRLNGG